MPLTFWLRLVSQYAGLSLLQVEELGLVDYLILRRDAFIERLSKTEAGQEYLENAWRMTQTEPDRLRLRELKRQGGAVRGKQPD